MHHKIALAVALSGPSLLDGAEQVPGSPHSLLPPRPRCKESKAEADRAPAAATQGRLHRQRHDGQSDL